MNTYYLGVGTNENREAHLRGGIERLSHIGRVLALSTVYQSEAVGGGSPYWNAVIVLETSLDSLRLKDELRTIEQQEGRIKQLPDGTKSKVVTLDLDILCGGDAVPHPDLLTRAYVALPMAELAPEGVHPTTQDRFAEIATRFVKESGLTPVSLNIHIT